MGSAKSLRRCLEFLLKRHFKDLQQKIVVQWFSLQFFATLRTINRKCVVGLFAFYVALLFTMYVLSTYVLPKSQMENGKKLNFKPNYF